MPSCFSARLELLFAVDVVRLLDVVDDALELLVAEREAELPSALDQQEFIDGVENELRGYFDDRLSEFRALGSDVRELRPRSQHGDLTLLEFGLRQDVAVHVDEYLLDDLCPDGDRGDDGGEEHWSNTFQHRQFLQNQHLNPTHEAAPPAVQTGPLELGGLAQAASERLPW